MVDAHHGRYAAVGSNELDTGPAMQVDLRKAALCAKRKKQNTIYSTFMSLENKLAHKMILRVLQGNINPKICTEHMIETDSENESK